MDAREKQQDALYKIILEHTPIMNLSSYDSENVPLIRDDEIIGPIKGITSAQPALSPLIRRKLALPLLKVKNVYISQYRTMMVGMYARGGMAPLSVVGAFIEGKKREKRGIVLHNFWHAIDYNVAIPLPQFVTSLGEYEDPGIKRAEIEYNFKKKTHFLSSSNNMIIGDSPFHKSQWYVEFPKGQRRDDMFDYIKGAVDSSEELLATELGQYYLDNNDYILDKARALLEMDLEPVKHADSRREQDDDWTLDEMLDDEY